MKDLSGRSLVCPSLYPRHRSWVRACALPRVAPCQKARQNMRTDAQAESMRTAGRVDPPLGLGTWGRGHLELKPRREASLNLELFPAHCHVPSGLTWSRPSMQSESGRPRYTWALRPAGGPIWPWNLERKSAWVKNPESGTGIGACPPALWGAEGSSQPTRGQDQPLNYPDRAPTRAQEAAWPLFPIARLQPRLSRESIEPHQWPHLAREFGAQTHPTWVPKQRAVWAWGPFCALPGQGYSSTAPPTSESGNSPASLGNLCRELEHRAQPTASLEQEPSQQCIRLLLASGIPPHLTA